MEFANASRFADDHDVVLVGYRGVDGSVRLDCPEVVSALKHSTDLLGEKSFQAYGDGFRACADRLTDDGVDLAGYGLPQQVEDMEAARKAFGYEKIDLLSESAGTRTAMIYSWRHPESIHRSVMVAVNPPGHFLWDGKTTDEQLARYGALCSEDGSCSRRTDDLAASMNTDIPDRWLFLPIKDGNVRVASFYGLVESGSEAAPISAPMTLDSWLSAEDGDASGFWFQSLLADLAFPESFVWGQMAAAARLDAQAATDSFSSESLKADSNLGDAATSFIWGDGRLADSWPAAPYEGEYSTVRTSNVETLLINGELDLATPPQGAEELPPQLPNGREVVLPGFGHSTTFWTEQPEAGTHLVNTYLTTGEVDDSLYEPQTVDFTPEVTQTALAKGIAGATVGLALLVPLSLLWMARRVRKRGGFGRKAGAVLRSLWAVVLGLGGWFAGVLIAITTMPGVPLDDELLAGLSVGLPIGLGVYLAWTNRDRPAETKTVGFAAALAGGLLGAWLGFHATTDLLALLTAIVGSIAGANLALILLDMARARPAGDEQAATNRVDARPANLEPAAPIGAGSP
jgi:pimeloyl-ACP methyl ester carboxylesterase